MPVTRFLLVVLLALLAGCTQDRELFVKVDGSGTISDRTLLPRDSYLPEKPEPSKEGEPLTLALPRPSPELASEQAAKFGEGVKVVSYKKIEDQEWLGYEATYEFPDIRKLKVDSFVLSRSGDAAAEPAEGAKPRYFGFTEGAVAELIIPMKEPAVKGEPKPKPEPAPEVTQQKPPEAKWSELIPRVNMRCAIKVEGTIEETNAHFREQNEIVLFQFDGKGIAADPEFAEQLKKLDANEAGPSEQSVEDDLKVRKYFKNEDADVVKISFQ